MKKTNRLVALALALVMILSMFVGCSNQQGREELKNALETKQNEDQGKTEVGNSNSGNSSENDLSAQIAQIQKQLNSLSSELDMVKAEKEALEGENTALKSDKEGLETENSALKTENATLKNEKSELQTENFNLKTENASLEKLVEELEGKSAHKIVVRDNIIWVHIEDFLYAANGVGALISAEDNTGYALRTLKGVHVKVYDDEHGDEHLVPNFDLPMYDYYTIVLTADEGKTAFTASFGNYNWANRGLVTSFEGCKFAKELTAMPKNGGSGRQFYNLIKATAVVVSENGTYRFALDADNYGANPVVKPTCNHGSGCHCGNCDKCPALEPETIVKTETIEKVVEVEKIVEVPGETVYVPGETVYIPGETIYVPGQDVNWCGRCGYLMAECICKNDDTWKPDDNKQDDTWKPDDNKQDDTWNPDTTDNKQDDTWNPDTTDNKQDDTWTGSCGSTVVEGSWNSSSTGTGTTDNWIASSTGTGANDSWAASGSGTPNDGWNCD